MKTETEEKAWRPLQSHLVSAYTIAEARKVIGDALKEDKGLKWGYISNIAMLLHDKYGITNYSQRNRAAEDILRLVFWSK